MQGLNAVFIFLVDVIFNILLLIVMLRLVLQFLRANLNNPICKMIAKITDPVVLPLRKALPTVYSVDLACVLLFFAISFVKFIIYGFFYLGKLIPLGYLAVFLGADFIIQLCDLFFYAILIYVVLSWIRPNETNALTEVLYVLVKPWLSIGRKIIPDVSGFDFSPIIAMLLLKIITLFMTANLPRAFF